MPSHDRDMERGAQQIANLMENSSNFNAVADRLRADCLNMDPSDFKRFAQMLDARDKSGGIDLVLGDKNLDGLPELTLVDENASFMDRKLGKRETTITPRTSISELSTPTNTYIESRR